jgi:hypothetical protein
VNPSPLVLMCPTPGNGRCGTAIRVRSLANSASWEKLQGPWNSGFAMHVRTSGLTRPAGGCRPCVRVVGAGAGTAAECDWQNHGNHQPSEYGRPQRLCTTTKIMAPPKLVSRRQDDQRASFRTGERKKETGVRTIGRIAAALDVSLAEFFDRV